MTGAQPFRSSRRSASSPEVSPEARQIEKTVNEAVHLCFDDELRILDAACTCTQALA